MNSNCDNDIPGVIDTPGRKVTHLDNTQIALLNNPHHTTKVIIKPEKRESSESPKPPQKFRFGQLVSCPAGYKVFGTCNVNIMGYEWGEHHRNFKQPIWLCFVRPKGDMAFPLLVAESCLSQIS